jgi:hypothetical protein
MNSTRSRSILIANVCALVVASVVVVEGAYLTLVVHERPTLENYLTHDAWGFFIPALVMFIIRSRIFSWLFLSLYIALSVQMFFEARSVFLDTYKYPPGVSSIGYIIPFLTISIFCLATYAVFALIDFVAMRFDLKR